MHEDSGKVHIAAESATKRTMRACLGREGGRGRGGGRAVFRQTEEGSKIGVMRPSYPQKQC